MTDRPDIDVVRRRPALVPDQVARLCDEVEQLRAENVRVLMERSEQTSIALELRSEVDRLRAEASEHERVRTSGPTPWPPTWQQVAALWTERDEARAEVARLTAENTALMEGARL